MITELKKNNKQISKEQFVDFLKTYNKTNPIRYTDNNKRRLRIPQPEPVREPELEPEIPEDGEGEGEEEEKENDLTSWFTNKTTDLYNPKLPDVRDDQDKIRHNKNIKEYLKSRYNNKTGNEEVEGSMFGDSPRKTIKQTHIFFGTEFQNKTKLNNYMNTSNISINDINTELELLGEERQTTKKDGKKLIEGHFLRKFIPSPTKQGKGLNLTNKLYINNKHFLDEGELEKNNLVMKSNNTNRIIYNMKPVKKT